jgi:hypothetical protein
VRRRRSDRELVERKVVRTREKRSEEEGRQEAEDRNPRHGRRRAGVRTSESEKPRTYELDPVRGHPLHHRHRGAQLQHQAQKR